MKETDENSFNEKNIHEVMNLLNEYTEDNNLDVPDLLQILLFIVTSTLAISIKGIKREEQDIQINLFKRAFKRDIAFKLDIFKKRDTKTS